MKTKKTILTILAISTLLYAYCQQPDIIYTDFEPDLCVSALGDNYTSDTIRIDFDDDGNIDFKIFIAFQSSVNPKAVYLVSSWNCRSMQENDSIVPSEESNWAPANYCWEFMFYPYNAMYVEKMLGFRKIENGENYYAWANVYIRREQTNSYPKVWACCGEMVYCSIPNYPLQWGQTDITSVNEKEIGFATFHPNPTQGRVTITGENLQQADVFNMLGQKLLGVKGKGNELQINIAALPLGIYFITVTDEEGRKCVRKVVKE